MATGRCRVRVRVRWLVPVAVWAGLTVCPVWGQSGGSGRGAEAGELSSSVSQLEAMQAAFAGIAEQVGPSVVAITTTRRLSRLAGGLPLTSPPSSLPESLGDRLVPTAGSGFVIDAGGLILTNQHVIADAEDVSVLLPGGRRVPARVVGADARSDLAVLRVEVEGLSAVRFAGEGTVRRGHWAIAMGNPFGITSESADGQASMTVGLVSAVGRQLGQLGVEEDRHYGNLIQTSAPIHQGNSGGPLLNIRGEVIGVVTAIRSRSGVGEGFGFAVPITSRTRQIIGQLSRGEAVEYGFLGVAVVTATAEDLAAAGLGGDGAALIERVEPGMPAETGGLQAGDLVLRFGGVLITGSESFVETVGAAAVDRPVVVELIRDGRRLEREVRPARRSWALQPTFSWRGIVLAERTAAEGPVGSDAGGEGMGQESGGGLVVRRVESGSSAEAAGVLAGMVIVRVGDRPVRRLSELLGVLAVSEGAVRLEVAGRAEAIVVGE